MHPYRQKVVAALIVGAVAGVVHLGCGDDGDGSAAAVYTRQDLAAAEARADAPRQSFAGTVEGSDAYIGIIAYGTAVTAYVCDGVAIAKWFDGQLDGPNLSATARDGSTLEGTIRDDTLAGVVTIANAITGGFSAPDADFPAGLWQLGTPTLRVGWVVLADGSQRGAGTGEDGIKPTLAVNTETGEAGDDLDDAPAAPPSSPPEPDPALLRKKCRAIQRQYESLLNQAAELGRKTFEITLALDFAVQDWADTGCKKRFGSIGSANL